MKESIHNDVFDRLRSKAERILSDKWAKDPSVLPVETELKQLFHELEVYQVELEMQNDELTVSREQIEKERLRFANLFDLAPVGYFILDKSGVILECNAAGTQLISAPRGKTTGLRFANFILADDGMVFYKFVHDMLGIQQPQSCQLKMKSLAGSEFYAQLEGKCIANTRAFSEKSFYYLAVIDITEKRKIELEQRETKEQLQMALMASLTGSWHLTFPGKKISLDRFATSITGLKEGNFTGDMETFLEALHPNERGAVAAALEDSACKGSALDAVFRIVKAKQVRHISIKGKVVAEADNSRILAGVVTDVTVQKKLEEEANALKASQQKNVLKAVIEAQERERMRISTSLHDSVGQLLYAMSAHLEKSNVQDHNIKNAASLLNRAITETRNISFELAPSVLTDFGLEFALKEMTGRLSLSELEFSLKILGLKNRLTPVFEILIFRIVQELVNNIIKHAKASRASIRISRKNDTISIIVTDNGIGFYNQKATNASGLHSIKNRLALYNGTLNIHSRKNAGTTVTVTLPGIEH